MAQARRIPLTHRIHDDIAQEQHRRHQRSLRISHWIYDAIARAQHRRHQRLFPNQEHSHVPDTALSRAQPPGEPTPTDAALSIADTPEETDHLTVGVEEDTEDEEPVSR